VAERSASKGRLSKYTKQVTKRIVQSQPSSARVESVAETMDPWAVESFAVEPAIQGEVYDHHKKPVKRSVVGRRPTGPAVEVVHPGASYHPSSEQYLQLYKEKEKQEHKLQAQLEKREKAFDISLLKYTTAVDMLVDEPGEKDALQEPEESFSKPVVANKKSVTQRNREKRAKRNRILNRKQATLKQRQRLWAHVRDYCIRVQAARQKRDQAPPAVPVGPAKPKKIGRYPVPEEPVVLKGSLDEPSALRKIKSTRTWRVFPPCSKENIRLPP